MILKVLMVLLLAVCDHQGPPDYVIDFGWVPDLETVDEYGRQEDSFQFFIPSLPDPEYIVRGSELSCGLFMVVVRETGPPDPGDPCSGGWGPVIHATSYEVFGSVVTFSIPTHITGGYTSYDLETYRYGTWQWKEDWCARDLPGCMTGPGIIGSGDCWRAADFDADGDIDLRDYWLATQVWPYPPS